MWLMHDFPFLKLACSWCSSMSTAVVMCWRMMQQKTLLVMDSSVMPHQLLHSNRFHFFWHLMIVPSSKYHFIVPDVLEDVLKKLWHFLFFRYQHICMHIVVRWCFTFHSFLIVSLTSWMVMRPSLMPHKQNICSSSIIYKHETDTSLKSGKIPKTEGGKIHLNFVTVL